MDILRGTGPLLSALLLILPAVGVTEWSASDDTGRSITLPAPAYRIVTLAPHATDLVVAAGGAGRLAAIAAGSPPPPGLSGLPRISAAGPIDREALLQLEPDLVVGWQSGNSAADLDWLSRLGIPVYRSEPRDLEDIARTLRSLGRLTGDTAAADAAAEAFLSGVRTRCLDLPRRLALLIVWERPAMTVGGHHWINAVLEAAGFRNHFAGVPAGVFQVAPEALLAAGPVHRISLPPGTSDDPVLADLLSRPGSRLDIAVQRLCGRRLRITAAGKEQTAADAIPE